MSRQVQIACLQTRPKPDFESALSEALELAERAVRSGAEIVALPEYCGGLRSVGQAFAPPAAAENEHPVLKGLIGFADRNKIWVIAGSLAVTGRNGKLINRSFIIDDYGNIVSRYDKIHMFDIELSATEAYRESETVDPGNRAVVVETPFGRVGHSICYDLRFPNLYRDMAAAGAEILLVPAAFTRKTGEAHWHVLNRARAIENGAFVVAPCAIGAVEGGGESYGHSLLVDPWGEVLADGGDLPGIVQATIDLDAVTDARKRIPSLKNGRTYTLDAAERQDVA